MRALLDAADGGSDHAAAGCAGWDDLLQQVEQAQPSRWEGKRREFRRQTSFSETLSERSELVLAAWLTRAGIEFEFGQPGRPQPDLVLPEWGFGIEVGSRTVDDAQRLEDEIRAVVECSREPEHVQVTFDIRPLAIREKVRGKIVDMVRLGLEVDEEVVPARADQLAVRVRVTRTPSSGPTVDRSVESALLTPHLQDVETEIRSKVIKDRRKVNQATSMSTVLVIDIARCGLAWLRPLPMWERVLGGLLDEHDPYVAVAVMVTGPGDNGVQLAWSANPHCDPKRAEHVSRLFSQLGSTG